MPCARRAAIRKPASGAAAHSAEATVNTAIPAQNIFLRPYWSPSRPPTMRNAALDSPYPATIHSMAAGLAARPCWMLGRATLTTKKSRT
jgi:hypothetical protein